MTALSDLIDDCFANTDLTVSAVYKPLSGNIFDVRAVMRVNNESSLFLGTGGYEEGTRIRLRAVDVAVPVEGDLIALGFTTTDDDISAPNFWTTNTNVRRVRGFKRDITGLISILNVDEIQ